MPRYVIEREIANVGAMAEDDRRGAAGRSNAVLRELGPEIQWVHSYVTDEKMYCIYNAPSEELIRKHAEHSGFPAHKVSRVRAVIDPLTAESNA